MVKSCAAYNCTNRFEKGGNITFHRFPLSTPDLLKQWVIAMKRKDFNPTKYHFICSEHFPETCFLQNYVTSRRLTDDAVPSLFNFPAHLQKRRVKMDRSDMDYNSDVITTLPDPMMDTVKIEQNFLEIEIKEEHDQNFEYINSYQNSAQQPETDITFKRECLKEELDYKISDDYREETDPLAVCEGENKYEKTKTISKGRNNYEKNSEKGNSSNICFGVQIRNKNIMCDICKKQFSRISRLKDHINAVHNKIKQHACNTCGKQFSQAGNLIAHVKGVHLKTRHLEIKDGFVCKICSKVYSTSGSLKHHVNFFHKETKPFACKLCQNQYCCLTHLNRHLNAVHKRIKDYICDLCGKAFSQMPHLKYHINSTHKKLKNFPCKFCDKLFSVKGTLESHVKVLHMGIKYDCEKCEQKYSRLSVLKKHITSAHTETTV